MFIYSFNIYHYLFRIYGWCFLLITLKLKNCFCCCLETSAQFLHSLYPSMISASSVVSPVSSGLPPYPTVPSHCSVSQRVQPFSTASSTEPPDCRVLHATVENTKQPFFNLEGCTTRPPQQTFTYGFIIGCCVLLQYLYSCISAGV